MNILHYTLGLPPARSGGLTKYATDLMVKQSERNNVTLIYPGGCNLFFRSRRLKRKSPYGKVETYAIQNPVVVPILYGIKNPGAIVDDRQRITREQLETFYLKVRPDIFHLHTMMGLPLEILSFFREKDVKIIFTTHDYYGLCPKVNFINQDGQLCMGASGMHCDACNAAAPSTLFLRIRNSPWLLWIKNTRWLQKIMKRL